VSACAGIVCGREMQGGRGIGGDVGSWAGAPTIHSWGDSPPAAAQLGGGGKGGCMPALGLGGWPNVAAADLEARPCDRHSRAGQARGCAVRPVIVASVGPRGLSGAAVGL
jgi:hypothetical protein